MGTKQNKTKKKELQGKDSIQPIIEALSAKKYNEGLKLAEDSQKLFIKKNDSKNISICLSLIGLLEFQLDTNKYLKALTHLNDGKNLAECLGSTTAKLMNEFAFAEVEFIENNLKESLSHYEKAQKYALIKDDYNMISIIEPQIIKIQTAGDLPQKRDPLIALLKIGQTVSAETDINVLIKVIAEETKSAIQADRCTVFLLDKDKNELWSKVALGLDSEEIRFPADKGLAGHVVKTGETINIKNAYNDKRFNKEIDKQTGYKTKNILCMPIKNLNQKIIGAFQVLNKFNGDFTDEDEGLLIAIGSSAGIALENAQLFKQQQQMLVEQKQVFDSFIDTLAASIDARDKITSGHSLRVRLYSGLIARELELDDKMVEIIETAATLHDIGKIGIRDSVLQKEGKLTDEEYKHIQEHVEITHNILCKIHSSDEFKLVTEIACSHHEKYNGFGYYRKLEGKNIHIGGRILAVADVFDAITSKRHYRDKMPIANVIQILIKDSGSHFDKSIVDMFLSISADKIIGVFLTENKLSLKDEHKRILSNYSLEDLFKFLTETGMDKLNKEQQNFVELFEFYYTAKSNKENNI